MLLELEPIASLIWKVWPWMFVWIAVQLQLPYAQGDRIWSKYLISSIPTTCEMFSTCTEVIRKLALFFCSSNGSIFSFCSSYYVLPEKAVLVQNPLMQMNIFPLLSGRCGSSPNNWDYLNRIKSVQPARTFLPLFTPSPPHPCCMAHTSLT